MDKGIVVKCVTRGNSEPSKGSAGLKCHVYRGITTVSNVAGATGRIDSQNIIQTDTK